jgi:hypothetical protein
MRRDRWMTRQEHDRMREEIAEAGSTGAWIRQSANDEAKRKQRTKMRALNALARKFGFNPPYPELDRSDAPIAFGGHGRRSTS